MSLLQKQTSSLLGIGSGDIQAFAAGIRSRRKSTPGMTREEALAQATANEGQDLRLQQTGDIRPTHAPQESRLKLTTDDQAFIEKVQQLGTFTTAIMGGARPGESDMARLRAGYMELNELAANTSREGIADIWSGVVEAIGSAPRLVDSAVGTFADTFHQAMQQTSQFIDVGLDTSAYTFEAGRSAEDRIKGTGYEGAVVENARGYTLAETRKRAAAPAAPVPAPAPANVPTSPAAAQLSIAEQARERLLGGLTIR